MRKIKEWLGELPEPHRAKALVNLDETENAKPDDFVRNLEQALINGFCWDCSNEGQDYWEAVYQNLDE